MPCCPVSRDLKACILILCHEQGLSAKTICQLLGVKKSLVYQTLIYSHTYGVPFNPHSHRSGQHRKLLPTDLDFIYSLLEQRHCSYLTEIQEALATEQHVHVSLPMVLQTLQQLHFSHKCVSSHALERNNLLCSAYMNQIAMEVPDPEMLMFIDEVARNRKTSGRKWGWSLIGKRCIQRWHFVRGQRYSILPVLTLDGIIAHDVIKGSVTTNDFVTFLRELVVWSSVMSYDDFLIDIPLWPAGSSHKSLSWAPKHSHPQQLQHTSCRGDS